MFWNAPAVAATVVLNPSTGLVSTSMFSTTTCLFCSSPLKLSSADTELTRTCTVWFSSTSLSATSSSQNSRFTNRYSETGIDPIGDLNPILNPVHLADVPGPSRLPGPDERRRTSLYSRIFDEESRNGRENIDELTASEVYHIGRVMQ